MVEDFDISRRKQEAEYRVQEHRGHFVLIDYRSSDSKIKTAMGILRGVSPSGLLTVLGDKGQQWDVDPLMITSFYGRPDRGKGGGVDGR